MVESLHAMKSRKFKVKTPKVTLIQFSGSCQLKLSIQKYGLYGDGGWGPGETTMQTLK